VFCEHKFAQQGREILAEAGLSSTATAAPTTPTDSYRPPGV
jgi:hypothetical protein